MKYTVTITIRLKEGMLNPEARAIQHALKNLGFQTEDLTTA
ncbi:MAG: phosphoribosylformylglycinamidine synthase subunit PurS, partial [Methanoculleus sp.]